MCRNWSDRWIASAVLLLGLCLTFPAYPQLRPHPPAHQAKIHMVLAGGECQNCISGQDSGNCGDPCVMPLAALMTNESDELLVVTVTLTLVVPQNAKNCGNNDETQTFTFMLGARSWTRIDFGHTFSGEFHGAVFTANARVGSADVGPSQTRQMEFDAVIPLCGGEDEQ